MAVKLPGIAVGNKDFTFGDALRATTNNTWRFIGLLLLFAIAQVLLGLGLLLVAKLSEFAPVSVGAVALLTVQLLGNWVTNIFSVTVLTSLYGYFAERREF